MLKVKPDNKGFTLVELIITVAIMTLIGVALVGIMSSNTVAFRKTKSDLDVQNVAEDTFNKISNDIMQAKIVYIKSGSDEYKSELLSKYKSQDEIDLYAEFDKYFPGSMTKFDTLKTENTSSSDPKYLFTQLDIDELAIGYLIPFDSKFCSSTLSSPPMYDYCVVHYNFIKAAGDNPGRVDVTYHYVYMDELNKIGTTVYTDLLGSNGVTGEVDAENNSIKLTMDFEKNDRKYTSNGMITIRNSYVLAEPK
jgi:type II secretory pathway pseudopilin PulG